MRPHIGQDFAQSWGESIRRSSNIAEFFNGSASTSIHGAEEGSFYPISDALSEAKHVEVISAETLRNWPHPIGARGKALAVWELHRLGLQVKRMQLFDARRKESFLVPLGHIMVNMR